MSREALNAQPYSAARILSSAGRPGRLPSIETVTVVNASTIDFRVFAAARGHLCAA